MSDHVQAFLASRDIASDFVRCKVYLEQALERAGGTHGIEDVAAGITDGRYHFWPGRRSAAITEVLQFPRCRYLNIFLAGGNMAELLGMIPLFKSWGLHLGCTKLVESGRVGWERVLGARGWKREVVVLSTEIEGSTRH